jgi:hypothetical protein
MESLILIAVLICPVVMGTMMFLMWRGMRHGNQASAQPPPSEVAEPAHHSVADDGRPAAAQKSEVRVDRGEVRLKP